MRPTAVTSRVEPCTGAWSARDPPFSLSLGAGGMPGSVQAPGGTCEPARPSYLPRHALMRVAPPLRAESSHVPRARGELETPHFRSAWGLGVCWGACKRRAAPVIDRALAISPALAFTLQTPYVNYEQSRAMCGRVVSSRRPIFAQPGGWGCGGERASAGRLL